MITMNYELNKEWHPQGTKTASLFLTICFAFHLLSFYGCSIDFVLSHVVLFKIYHNSVSVQRCCGQHLSCGTVSRIKLQKMLHLFVIHEF
jgi:hypothetical protein